MAEDKEKRAKKKICEIILARRMPIAVTSFHVTHSDRHLHHVSEQQNQVGKEGLWRRVMVQEEKDNKRKISWMRSEESRGVSSKGGQGGMSPL